MPWGVLTYSSDDEKEISFCNTLDINNLIMCGDKLEYFDSPIDKTPYKWDGKKWVRVTNKGVL